MDSQWRSKREILNDLAEVTGTLDEEEVLTTIHDRPPNKVTGLDDESELFLRMCGAAGSHGRGAGRDVQSTEFSPPDLPNIERMLQMVYESEDFPNRNDMEDFTKHKTQKIIISKLNPHVKEFIPANVNNIKDKSTKIDLDIHNKNDKDTKENNEISHVVCKDIESVSFEIKDELEKPKNIEDFDAKMFRKNVAMSSINTINANNSNNIKLFTPDDFLVKTCPEKKIEHVMADNLESFRNKTLFAPEILEEDSREKLKIKELRVITDIDPNLEVTPQEVQESIEKVNNWFEPKHEQPSKPKAPHLSVITFKKKKRVSPKPDSKMANLTTDTSSQSSTSPSPYNKYKPSKYADELIKKFENNAAKALVKPSEDLWSKLQRNLREKDEALRKKALEEEKSRATPAPTDSAEKNEGVGKRR